MCLSAFVFLFVFWALLFFFVFSARPVAAVATAAAAVAAAAAAAAACTACGPRPAAWLSKDLICRDHVMEGGSAGGPRSASGRVNQIAKRTTTRIVDARGPRPSFPLRLPVVSLMFPFILFSKISCTM